MQMCKLRYKIRVRDDLRGRKGSVRTVNLGFKRSGAVYCGSGCHVVESFVRGNFKLCLEIWLEEQLAVKPSRL